MKSIVLLRHGERVWNKENRFTGWTDVALTEKACSQIKILDGQHISEEDRESLKTESEANRSKGIALADEICRKYRREGRFFDEILKAGE